jgi:hypothetical protein
LVENVDRLGFPLDDPSYIPDYYLEKQNFKLLKHKGKK